ncbi:MAG: DUF2029 domain-containing protein [Thermoleophilia bacterium]|nr:DUF2029 domain-containing protein [Thermoleophilia bacterium]
MNVSTGVGERNARLLDRVGAPLKLFFFAVLPVIVTGQVLVAAIRLDAFAVDFHHSFRPAAAAVLDGRSPYLDAGSELASGAAFVYPPVAAVVLTPFALVPAAAGDALFTALLVASALLALWALGVRDPRCYGVTFLWAPVFSAVQTANVTLLLVLGLAVVWRHRDRFAVAATVTAVVVASKLFLWPLVVWLALTRRYRAAAAAVALGAALTFGAWAAIGFAGLREYPATMRVFTRLMREEAYTPFAVALQLGIPEGGAHALGLVIGGAVLAGSAWFARHGRADKALVLAIAAAILFSPLVWLHYFALLLVPLAILRPTFGPLWLFPLGLWICPARLDGPNLLAAIPLAVGGLMLFLALRDSGERLLPDEPGGGRRWRRPLPIARRTEANTAPA